MASFLLLSLGLGRLGNYLLWALSWAEVITKCEEQALVSFRSNLGLRDSAMVVCIRLAA